MSAPGRSRHLLTGSLAVIAIVAALACIVRVPAGQIGLLGEPGPGRRVLAPGFHARWPLQPYDLYPAGVVRIQGEAAALSREGSSIPVGFRLEAGVDADRAGLLPRRSDLSQGDLAEQISSLVALELARPGPTGGEDLARRVRVSLEAQGFRVASSSFGADVVPARRLERPIVLIGLDGADWQIIDPLIERGLMPNIARLKARATWGHLRSFEPILSPLLWTTAVTGKAPDEHGVIDFLVPDPATGQKLPISSRARRVPALWNIFSQRGLTTDFVAWWASWPAESVRGRIVSDRVAYSLFDVGRESAGLTWPPSLWQALEEVVVDDSRISYEQVRRFLDITPGEFDAARAQVAADAADAYKHPVNHLTKILASTATYHQAAIRLLREGQPDLLGVYYQGIDEVSHRFAHFMPPKMSMVTEQDFRRYRRAVEEFYVYQDELLGDLLSHLAPESTLIIMSDHGFRNGTSRPADGPADIEGKPGKWHRLYGVIMIAGQGIPSSRLDTATLYDVTPTILALAGLPQADDMRGGPLVAVTGIPGGEDHGPGRIASYDAEAPGPGPSAGDSPVAASAANEELLKNLESLGYIGGAESSRTSIASATAPSPAGSVTSHANMASLLIQRGDWDGAEKELRQALALQPAYFPALMGMGRVLVRQGRTSEALEMTRTAVATAADAEPGAYVQLAMLAASLQQTPQAMNFLSALRQRRPRAVGIPVALGVLALSAGASAEGEAYLREALEMDPGSPDAMVRLFNHYRARGREAELEEEVRAGIAIDGQSIYHHNWLGLIHMRRGDAPAAEAEFRRALQLAPDFGGTMANLGSLYGRSGRLEEAVDILSRAVRIEPGNLEARVNLGAALAKLGRLDEAIQRLEEARGMGLGTPELLNAVGLAYAQSGRTGEAIDALEESITLRPDQPEVRSLLSQLRSPA